MTIKIEGFSEVFYILNGLFSGIKSAIQLPDKNRKEMRDAIADNAELIDHSETTPYQHCFRIQT